MKDLSKLRICWKCHQPHATTGRLCRSCQKDVRREELAEQSQIQRLIDRGLLPKNWREQITEPIIGAVHF